MTSTGYRSYGKEVHGFTVRARPEGNISRLLCPSTSFYNSLPSHLPTCLRCALHPCHAVLIVGLPSYLCAFDSWLFALG